MNQRTSDRPPAAVPRRAPGVALLAAAALVLGACRDDSDDPPPPETAAVAGTLGVGPASGSGGALLEQEPNDSPSQVQFVGEVGPGTAYTIRGSITDDGSDPFDGFRFEATAALGLHMELSIDEPGADLDVLLVDAETGETLEAFESDQNPEIGDFFVEAGAQFDLVVYSFLGASTYELALGGTPGTAAPSAPSAGALASVRSPDAGALYLGAGHPMVEGRVVALESDAAFHSPARAAFLGRNGLAPVSRSADGTTLYRLESAPALRRGSAGAWRDSVEHATARAAWRLSRQPGVRAASPDYLAFPHTLPNDTHYPLQWHYPQMKLPLAWEVATGTSDVLVAVIDTGHTAHPDLLSRIVGQYDFISDPQAANDGDGMDADATDAGDGQGPVPSSYHGTHVSGTVGARTDDMSGVAGVDWGCGLYSLRALGVGGGAFSDIAAAVRYAARLPNASGALPAERADVINMSLGSPSFSSVLEAACLDARNAGATLVASAGNEPNSTPKYPAAFGSVIAVGAVRFDKQLAPYSTFGTWVDVVAPGGDLNVDQNGDGFPDGVLSTYTDGTGDYFYAFQQGTSMASPHVAGLASLLIGLDPGLTPLEVRDLLRSTAHDLGPAGADATFGHGLVNAYAALIAIGGTPATDPVLAVEPAAIDFGSSDSTATISISNAGGGTLEVLEASVSYADGAGWLAAALVPAPAGADTTHSGVTLSVDRAGLAPDSYSAMVRVRATDQPDALVSVLMRVGDPTVADHTVFVLLVESTTYETVDQAVTDLAASYSWSMSDVPAGSYYLVAGTDENDDDFIGDAGEPLFGMWPSSVDPMVLVLDAGSTLQDLDFPVDLGEIGALGASAGAFRRLR